MYRKSPNQNRHLLISALPLALMILFVLFSQLNPPRTLAQQEATVTSVDVMTALPSETEITPPDPQQQVEEYASIAHALQAQALAPDNPFLAYRLAVEAGSIDNPPAEAYSSLLSMVYDTNALNSFSTLPAGISTLALSDDGQRVVILTTNGTLQLFDSATHELLQTYRAPRGYLAGADFTADGSMLYITQPDNQLLLEWNVTNGQIRRMALDQGFGTIKVSPDGQRALAATFYDNNLFLLDLTTRETLMSFAGYPSSVTGIAFSPEGNLALVGYYDGALILYDLTTGVTLRTLQNSGYPIYAIAFNHDGGSALVGNTLGTLSLWSISDGSLIYSLSNYSPGGIMSVAFSPNGFYGVTGGSDGTVIVWEISAGTLVFRTRVHHTYVTNIAFSADSRTFVTGDSNGNAFSWGFSSSERVHVFYGHESGVTRVAFSPNGRTAASGDNFGSIMLWDPHVFVAADPYVGHTGSIYGLDFSPDGRYLLSGSADGSARLWNLTGETAGETVWTVQVDNNQVYAVTFSPDGKTASIVAGSSGALVLDTDPDSDTFGEILRTFEAPDALIFGVAYSPDGSRLAGSSSAGDILIWDFETGEEIQHIVTEDMGQGIQSIDYSPDGTILATALQAGGIVLWDTGSGQRLHTLEGHPNGTTSLDFSPDGRTLISGGEDFQVVLWDVATGQRIETYTGHSNRVNAVTFSPDGRQALSASWDFNVRVWSIPSVPELINRLLTERYVPELTCNQRIVYRVEPYCDSAGTVPTETPYPTLTPTARGTSIISTSVPFPTSTLPATAVTMFLPAQVGEQRGEIEVGGGDVWTYNGSYGEVLNILVEADHPANNAEDRAELFDTYLIVRSPLGTTLYSADDIEAGVITDSQVYYLTLPTTGVYEIEVRSWNDESGGGYTLTIESIPFVPPTAVPTSSAAG